MDASQTPMRWRHDLHRIPETDFAEVATAAYVAGVLGELGLAVHTGIGGTGVIGVLETGRPGPRVGLRAELDALAMTETADVPFASQHPGFMHACGHDGHMAMLLGAAALLRNDSQLTGTVYFVFQPDEEHGHGAKAMLDDGMLTRFPMDAIYGMHNMPGLPAGQFATRAGGIMASEDNFVITIHGRGGHASSPHRVIDPLVIGAEIVLALQTIVARSVDPQTPAVVSCTEFITDGIRNAIPSTVVIKGDTRSYSAAVQQLLEQRMRDVCAGICAAHGATAEVQYTHEFAPTVNPVSHLETALAAAQAVSDMPVLADIAPLMGSEDFGLFLTQVPGNFLFIGNGVAGLPLHNAGYRFNDEILVTGARYFAEVVRRTSA
jgi:hippurate hydrolase